MPRLRPKGHVAVRLASESHAPVQVSELSLSSTPGPSPNFTVGHPLDGGSREGAEGVGGAGEQLLSRLRSETQGRLQLQQQVLDLERQNVEGAMRADGMALELEAMRKERSLLQERSERLEVTLHMLEQRNMRLSGEAHALQDSMAALSSSRDVLMQERDKFKERLRKLEKEGADASSSKDAEWRGRLGSKEAELKDTHVAMDAIKKAKDEVDHKLQATIQELHSARQQQAAAGQLLEELQAEQTRLVQVQALTRDLIQQQEWQQQRQVDQQESTTVSGQVDLPLKGTGVQVHREQEVPTASHQAAESMEGQVKEMREQAGTATEAAARPEAEALRREKKELLGRERELREEQEQRLQEQRDAATSALEEYRRVAAEAAAQGAEAAAQAAAAAEGLARVQGELAVRDGEVIALRRFGEQAAGQLGELMGKLTQLQRVVEANLEAGQGVEMGADTGRQLAKVEQDESTGLSGIAEGPNAGLAKVDSTLSSAGLTLQAQSLIDDLEVQLKRASLDRDIVAGNLASAVRQAMAMMGERDAAVREMQGAQAREAAAVAQQEVLQEEVATLHERLGAASAQVDSADAARRAAEHARQAAVQELQEAAEKFRATEQELLWQLDQQRVQAAITERVLQMRVQAQLAVTRGVAPGKAPSVAFANTNRYWVPQHLVFEFMKSIAAREVLLQDVEGFIGLVVKAGAEGVYEVATQWDSIPHFEAYSVSPAVRKCQLPVGVMQYVPKKGQGFPEDYVPFKDLSEAVNAKY